MMAAMVLPEFRILNCRRCLIPGLLHYGIDKIACPEDSLVCLDLPHPFLLMETTSDHPPRLQDEAATG